MVNLKEKTRRIDVNVPEYILDELENHAGTLTFHVVSALIAHTKKLRKKGISKSESKSKGVDNDA